MQYEWHCNLYLQSYENIWIWKEIEYEEQGEFFMQQVIQHWEAGNILSKSSACDIIIANLETKRKLTGSILEISHQAPRNGSVELF